jgi:serine/threonine-protein kinase
MQGNDDLNLLFALKAFQNDFLSHGKLIAALKQWATDKAQPMAQLLQENKLLDADKVRMVQQLVELHVKARGLNSAASLHGMSQLPLNLGEVEDPEVREKLAPLTSSTVQPLGGSDPVPPRYRKLRELGRGGRGVVWVAFDGELHREVALKEPNNDQQATRSRFVVEAEVTGRLEHPGIAPVYDLVKDCDGTGRPQYAMRYCGPGSLSADIERFHSTAARHGPGERMLALRRLLGQFKVVCNAVGYAHSRGILHRDLKPKNVVLGPFDQTLVVDWGEARVLGQAEAGGTTAEKPIVPSASAELSPTAAGTIVGTPEYMSPEQAEGAWDKVGPASDIYSLGATLYHILTGMPPFYRADTHLQSKRASGQFPKPRRVNPQIAPALQAICLKAMASRPEDRYAEAKDLADDVEHWLAEEPVTAYAEPWRLRAGRWLKHHRPLAASIATTLLALTLLGSGGWW